MVSHAASPHASPHRLSLIQLHLGVLLAGGAGLFGKYLALNPVTITCGRTAFGSMALLIVAVLTSASLRLRTGRDWFVLTTSGVVLALHWFSFFQSIQVSTVALGLLSFAAFPLFVTFFEPVIFGERLRRMDVMTAVMVVAGLVLVTPEFDFSHHLTQGMMWGLLSAFTYAVLSLLSRSSVRTYPAVTVAFYQQGIAALCVLPLALKWEESVTGRDILLLLGLGVVFTAFAHALVIASLRHLRAQTTGVVFGLEPVYGITLAWLLLREVPSLRTLAGGLLICSAVIWASWRGNRFTELPADGR